MGDKYCGDAFALASLLLEAENVRHVVAGRIVGVSGLPDTLDEELDVDVDFRISGVRIRRGSKTPCIASRMTRSHRK